MADEKTPLGKILLKHKAVDAEQLAGVLERREQGERLASSVAKAGITSDAALLKALSEQSGHPGLDLAQIVIPLKNLDLVPKEIAKAHTILTVLVKDDRIFVALADPQDTKVIDEIEFVTGKKIYPYVALHGPLTRVIDEAYALRTRGAEYYCGPAVPAEYRERLGLGAAAALEAPAAFDAAVVVEDRAAADPAGAARVTATLDAPGRAVDRSTSTGSVESARQADTKRLLVVEDDAAVRGLVLHALAARGYAVTVAVDGAEALDRLAAEPPDAVVLDAALPGVHGFEVLRRMRTSETWRAIPVIVTSGVYRGWRFAHDLRENFGVAHYVEKPFSIDDLLARVERTLGAGDVDAAEATDATTPQARAAMEAGLRAYHAGDAASAVTHLRRAVSLEPSSHVLHYHLGLVHGRSGHLYDAIHEMERAVELNPRLYAGVKNLAVLYQKAGFRLKAVEMWERALGLSPDEETRKGIKEQLLGLL